MLAYEDERAVSDTFNRVAEGLGLLALGAILALFFLSLVMKMKLANAPQHLQIAACTRYLYRPGGRKMPNWKSHLQSKKLTDFSSIRTLGTDY